MAAPTLTTMMSNVRLLIMDTNTTTAPYYTDAQITTFINLGLMWWYENNEKRIKSVTAIATTTNSAFEQDADSTFLYPEILGASIDITGIYGAQPITRIGWNEIKMRQNRDVDGSGTPIVYAALKYGGAAVSASAQNKWKFAFYPIPNGSYSVTCIVRDYPVALSAGADIVDLGDFEAKCVEIIAAIFAAPRSGRPELAQDLMGLLPQMVQDKLQTHMRRDEVVA